MFMKYVYMCFILSEFLSVHNWLDGLAEIIFSICVANENGNVAKLYL